MRACIKADHIYTYLIMFCECHDSRGNTVTGFICDDRLLPILKQSLKAHYLTTLLTHVIVITLKALNTTIVILNLFYSKDDQISASPMLGMKCVFKPRFVNVWSQNEMWAIFTHLKLWVAVARQLQACENLINSRNLWIAVQQHTLLLTLFQ